MPQLDAAFRLADRSYNRSRFSGPICCARWSCAAQDQRSKIRESADWDARISLIQANGLEDIADSVMERWFSPKFRQGHPEAVAGFRTMLCRTDPVGYTDVCTAIRDCDLRQISARIRQPTICIAGTDDLATPPSVVAAVVASLPQAQVENLTGIGHLPCIEAPGAVARAIIAQLDAL